jgi:hypothetical protein
MQVKDGDRTKVRKTPNKEREMSVRKIIELCAKSGVVKKRKEKIGVVSECQKYCQFSNSSILELNLLEIFPF